MTQIALTDYVIQDFKEQVSRLSEERALYFALATQKSEELKKLVEENEALKNENGNIKRKLNIKGAENNET